MELHHPRPTVKNPATSFTGDVWLTPVHSGTGPSHLTAALVRFTPGARTHWHRHDVGQTLHVSDGVGLVVIVPFAWSDGTCAFCRDGITTSCVHGGFFDGAPSATQAELLVVPQADGTAVKIPAGTDEALMPSLLTLSDVYLTGYHAPRQGQVGPGRTVTVIGDGAVGLSAVLASKELGAETIILTGRHTARTDLGRREGHGDHRR